MDWYLIVLSLLIAGGTIWGIRFFFNRKFSELGPVSCRWYTGPALSGLIIFSAYTLSGLYMYWTTSLGYYLMFFCFGLVLLGFYFFFGVAAIGDTGVFTNGRIIPWTTMYEFELTEKWGNRIRWFFRWKESPAPAGDRSTTVIIPPSRRAKAEEIIRTTLRNLSNDGKK